MKTIGCSGGSKLTTKDLEKIAGNMQAGAVVVHDTPDLAKSKPFASSGTYAVGKAKENQYSRGFRAGFEAGYRAAKEDSDED